MADEAGNNSETTTTSFDSSSISTEGASSSETPSSTDIREETSRIGQPEPSETESIIVIKPDEDQRGDDGTPIDDSTPLSRNSTSPSASTTMTSSHFSPFLVHVTVTSSSVELTDLPDVLAAPDTKGSTNDSIQPTITEEGDSSQQMRSSMTTTISSESPHKSDTSQPSANGSQTQNSHASTQQPTSTGDFFVDSLPTPVPFTTEDGIYVISSFTSTFMTILPNGATVTTSAVYETTISFANAQSNGDDNNVRGVNHPDASTGPPESVQSSPTSFFKKPAAAAGVFVAVSLVLGCVVWMFFILRRHRRQAATGKQRNYAYGATGYSPRNRGSYMSYDARNWPERFEENVTAPSTPPPPPAVEPPEEPRWRPGYVKASLGQNKPQMSTIHEPQATSFSSRPQHGRTSSVQPLISFTSTPPQTPARSPHRPSSPPVQKTNIFPSQDSGQEYSSLYRTDLLPPLLPICRSESIGRRPRIRASSSASASASVSASALPHLYTNPSPTNVAQDSITQSKSPHPIVLLRRTSERSTGSPVENPFSSPAYIVPSPTPSSDGREVQERLSNPFSDADSPPHSPVGLEYVHGKIDMTRNFPLDRGVSLRRTDSLREKPQRRQSTVTPEPGLMECGSSCGPGSGSGSEGASSSYTSHLAFRLDTRHRPPVKYDIPRRSGSLSTAESSVVSPKDDIASPIESELFYNPDFASSGHATNPPFPETAR